MAMCFGCGRKINGTVEEHMCYGSETNWHSKCWKRFQNEKEVTARAVTNESGQTYVDDKTYLNRNDMPVRLVHDPNPED